jgi:plastocyanin
MNIILTIPTFLIFILVINLASSAVAQEESNSVIIPLGAATPNNPPYYIPPEITVPSGTTVTWTNKDNTIHTVTEGSPGSTGSTPAFDSSLIAPSQTWDNTFDTAGEFNYYCTLHPFMTGKVTVS